jgi:hypothetical protein
VVVTLAPDVVDKLHDAPPNAADWLTGWGTVGLAAVAFTALLFTGYQIVQARGIERGQTFLEVSQRWNDSSFRAARIKIRDFYGADKKPIEVTNKLLALKDIDEAQYWECVEGIQFFESLALLIKYRLIARAVVDHLWGFIVWEYWAMLYDFVEHQRGTIPKDEEYCIEFEDLAKTIAKKNDYPTPWVDAPDQHAEEGPVDTR